MCNTFAMQILKSIDQLFVDSAGVVFAHPPLRLALQKSMRTASRHILKHEYNLVLGLDSFI